MKDLFKKAYLLIILSIGCVSLCGCLGFGTYNVKLNYDVAMKERPQNNIKIRIKPFIDNRTTKDIASYKNGFGTMGKAQTDTDVIKWVTDALAQELTRSGYSVVNDDSAHYVIEGKIMEVFCVIVQSVDSSIVLNVSLKNDGAIVFERDYEGTDSFLPMIVSMAGSTRDAIKASLRKSIANIIKDINKETGKNA